MVMLNKYTFVCAFFLLLRSNVKRAHRYTLYTYSFDDEQLINDMLHRFGAIVLYVVDIILLYTEEEERVESFCRAKQYREEYERVSVCEYQISAIFHIFL